CQLDGSQADLAPPAVDIREPPLTVELGLVVDLRYPHFQGVVLRAEVQRGVAQVIAGFTLPPLGQGPVNRLGPLVEEADRLNKALELFLVGVNDRGGTEQAKEPGGFPARENSDEEALHLVGAVLLAPGNLVLLDLIGLAANQEGEHDRGEEGPEAALKTVPSR